MSVDTTDTAQRQPALATTDQQPAKPKRSYTRKQPAPPRALVWVCERCEKAVRGSGAGFAYVDLRQAVDGAVRAAKERSRAPWRIAHAACVPDAVKPLNPFFRVWVERVADVDSLLDAMAGLSRLSWHGRTDWGGLVRRVLADTETAATERQMATEAAARRRAERSQTTLAPDDPRHGTVNAYNNYGCHCDECRAAATEASRLNRAARALSATDSVEDGAGE